MDVIIIVRFAIVFLFSFLYGYERQKAHKPIGFGTYIFVAVGSCALAVTAASIAPDNPLPLLGAIVTGIGFLGAGALIKTSDKIFGFTSAAGVWLFAIFGLVIGLGEYAVGGIVYVSVWLIIFVDRYLQHRGIGSYQKRLVVTTKIGIPEKEVKKEMLLTGLSYRLMIIEVDRTGGKMTYTYLVEGKKESINRLPDHLFKKDWFLSCRIE
ncbi:MAG: MgtC/SapB family protein [Nanoarchaeota archaeon]